MPVTIKRLVTRRMSGRTAMPGSSAKPTLAEVMRAKYTVLKSEYFPPAKSHSTTPPMKIVDAKTVSANRMGRNSAFIGLRRAGMTCRVESRANHGTREAGDWAAEPFVGPPPTQRVRPRFTEVFVGPPAPSLLRLLP